MVEFTKVIEPLTEDFHVVCPSLPGYGFSGKPSSTGWGIEKIAHAWDALMARLGYQRYGAQGGDWGAAVTTQIGRNGGSCIGIHTNMPVAFPSGGLRQSHARGEGRTRGGGVLRELGFRLLQAAVHPPADARLRIGRLAGRPAGLDHGEVLGVDRLRRTSRERAHP